MSKKARMVRALVAEAIEVVLSDAQVGQVWWGWGGDFPNDAEWGWHAEIIQSFAPRRIYSFPSFQAVSSWHDDALEALDECRQRP